MDNDYYTPAHDPGSTPDTCRCHDCKPNHAAIAQLEDFTTRGASLTSFNRSGVKR